MVEVDKGLVGDVRSSEPKATRPSEPSERTSTGQCQCQLQDEALQDHNMGAEVEVIIVVVNMQLNAEW